MGRDDDMPKLINNHRNMLRLELKKALTNHDTLTPESAPADAQLARFNLQHQYRKLYYLNELKTVIIGCKQGGQPRGIRMTDEQIQRNIDLRKQKMPP